MISFEYVSFGYDGSRETLAGLNAAIRPGECVLLCGASGCGKTTVTKLVNGLIPAFTPGCRLEGRVEVDGLDPAKTPMHQLARKVGSVFQNPKSQFFNLDTDSELAFGLENAGCPPEEIHARVAETVEALGLESLCGQSIFSLSGGQKQLLAFGSVYAMGPDIFVLDEPTANLDQEAIARLHDEIAGLKRQGRTVVIAEHRLYFLTDLIDQAWYIRQGSLSRRFTREETEELIRKALTFSAEPPERRQARTKKYLPVYVICCVLGVAGALAVWAAGLADIEGALALLIIGVVFGVVYGAYAMFWMAETLPRYYDENRICNFAQGAFHIHIPGVYYNNRNWKHILRAFRVWSMASLVLVPPCTAGAVFVERATGWQVWVAVLVVYIASLFGAIVIPAKRFE